LEVSAAVVIVTVGEMVSRRKHHRCTAAGMPAASVSFATMLWAPLADSVTLVDHAPPLPTVAVPIARAAAIVVEIDRAADRRLAAATVQRWCASPGLVRPPLLEMVTVGAIVSSVSHTAHCCRYSAASCPSPTMLWLPSPTASRWLTTRRACDVQCRSPCCRHVVEIDAVLPTAASPAVPCRDGVDRLVGQAAAAGDGDRRAMYRSVSTTGALLPVLPAASVSWPRCCARHRPQRELVDHAPPARPVAVRSRW